MSISHLMVTEKSFSIGLGGIPHRYELFHTCSIETTIILRRDEEREYISRTHSWPSTVTSLRNASSIVGSYRSVHICDTNCPVKLDFPTPFPHPDQRIFPTNGDDGGLPPLPNKAILYSLIPFGGLGWSELDRGCLIIAVLKTFSRRLSSVPRISGAIYSHATTTDVGHD